MSVIVTRNEPVYRPDAGENDPRFFRDVLIWSTHRDPEARERLHRHNLEQRVITSGAFVGAVVPQFITSLAAGPVRAGDPLLSALEHLALPPEGVTFTVPRSVTTAGTTANAQTSENTEVSDTDPSLVDLQRSLVTVAGQVDVSREVIDRGGSVTEAYLARDLTEAINTNIDLQLLEGTGTNGQLLGLRNVTATQTVTYTDTNPTRPEFLGYLGRMPYDLHNARLQSPDTFVMHPRRFWWFMASLGGLMGSLSPPFVYDDVNAPAVARYANIDIIIDANIPTTVGAGTSEDLVYCIRRADMPIHVGPVMISLDNQPLSGTWGVSVIAYRYVTWFPDRYRGTDIVMMTGTGLSSPGSWTS